MRPLVTLELLATPAAVSGVRRALRDYGTDVQLCASELVTNVIRHLGEDVPVTVRVSCDDGRTRLEVTDPDPCALPVLREAVTADESGRGLAMLDALALRRGVTQGPGSKTVWCELAARSPEKAHRCSRNSGERLPDAGIVRRGDQGAGAVVQSAPPVVT
ncbi:ATP-binding protein [Streptomyces sp. NWU339]|uniref:ATP-binding protein n=1 Tax=Streptomyces sp. NWU339 TaxID=2185284 RepID=UPI000D683E57|nr:ATP-binding protein [Streptomyces sp. NWU339]PWI11738.1 ATP-binding protein [Streptomyces sp. NWU339]